MSVYSSLINCSLGGSFPAREMEKSLNSRTEENLLNNCYRVKIIDLPEQTLLSSNISQNYLALITYYPTYEEEFVTLRSACDGRIIWKKEITENIFADDTGLTVDFNVSEKGLVSLTTEKKILLIYEGTIIKSKQCKDNGVLVTKILKDRIFICKGTRVDNSEEYHNLLFQYDLKGEEFGRLDLKTKAKPESDLIVCNENYWIFLSYTSKGINLEIFDSIMETHKNFEIEGEFFPFEALPSCISNNYLVFNSTIFENNFYVNCICFFDLVSNQAEPLLLDSNVSLDLLNDINSFVCNERFIVWKEESRSDAISQRISYFDFKNKICKSFPVNCVYDIDIFGSVLSVFNLSYHNSDQGDWAFKKRQIELSNDNPRREIVESNYSGWGSFFSGISQGIFYFYDGNSEQLYIEDFIEGSS